MLVFVLKFWRKVLASHKKGKTEDGLKMISVLFTTKDFTKL